MRFQVPQFIEVEDKIFGPLTIKQFIYIAGGIGLSVIFYLFVSPFIFALIFIIPVMSFALMLAFYKVNNKPFVVVLEAAFKYLMNPKLYLWRHQNKVIEPALGDSETAAAFIPKMSESKLKDLTWSLDTKEPLIPIPRETKK
jgi:hypothetical protein